MSQSSPITPLASSRINHDTITIEFLNPTPCRPWCGLFGRCKPASSIRKRSPMLQPRLPSCLHGHTLCWPQSGRNGDSNRAGRQGYPGLTPPPARPANTTLTDTDCRRRT